VNDGLTARTPLTTLEGIGIKTAKRLENLGVRYAEDLLYFLPRAYQDRTNPLPVREVTPGHFSTVRGQLLTLSEKRYRTRKTLEAMVTDGSGMILLKWFRYSRWLKESIEKRFPPGTWIFASGRASVFAGNLEMHHPDITEADSEKGAGIVPVYPLTEGLGQHVIRKAVSQSLQRHLPAVRDWIPQDILGELDLPDLGSSIINLHEPAESEEVEKLNDGTSPWHRRFRFGELFAFQIGLLSRKRNLESGKSRPVPADCRLEKDFYSHLPFELTRAQVRALSEIGQDMAKNTPMHRLLQGDVGSGKTLVAFVAMLRAACAGRQAVLMAPTEILAEQHYSTISRWCSVLDVEVGLITGSVETGKRDDLLKRAADGSVSIILGTHALIQEGVYIRDLALAVVDEQHRFGVLQRLALKSKGESPHFLVMTATPIPRSLTLVFYGDLDITTIDEMPAGRRPVKTVVFEESERSRMYLRIAKEVREGRQVYVVYPLIEESEKIELLAANEMARIYRENIFPHLSIGLITGRMLTSEKEQTMSRFRSGHYQVLVSTTVIEVGIDVPNATLMVIENAERFGLFQLHQLRGRVGRGTAESTCILMAGEGISEDARNRLKTIATTHSGFRIAEADLRMRGPGDFFGVRQSGLPGFRYADPFRDRELMQWARESAERVYAGGGKMPDMIIENVRNFWSGGMGLTESG
jgi:ATP-dependent DNA helicase RecG